MLTCFNARQQDTFTLSPPEHILAYDFFYFGRTDFSLPHNEMQLRFHRILEDVFHWANFHGVINVSCTKTAEPSGTIACPLAYRHH